MMLVRFVLAFMVVMVSGSIVLAGVGHPLMSMIAFMVGLIGTAYGTLVICDWVDDA